MTGRRMTSPSSALERGGGGGGAGRAPSQHRAWTADATPCDSWRDARHSPQLARR